MSHVHWDPQVERLEAELASRDQRIQTLIDHLDVLHRQFYCLAGLFASCPICSPTSQREKGKP